VGVDEEEIDELGLSRRWFCQLVPAQPALVIIISLPIPQLLLTAAHQKIRFSLVVWKLLFL